MQYSASALLSRNEVSSERVKSAVPISFVAVNINARIFQLIALYQVALCATPRTFVQFADLVLFVLTGMVGVQGA